MEPEGSLLHSQVPTSCPQSQPSFVVLYYIILYYITLPYSTLHYIILYYIILYYNLYILLYYTVWEPITGILDEPVFSIFNRPFFYPENGCSRTPWNLGAFLPGSVAPQMSPVLPCVTVYSTCHSLFQTTSDPCCESQLLRSTQQKVEELLTSGVILHPYSLSLDMHASALQALTSLHAVNRLKRWVETAHEFGAWDTSCSKNCLIS